MPNAIPNTTPDGIQIVRNQLMRFPQIDSYAFTPAQELVHRRSVRINDTVYEQEEFNGGMELRETKKETKKEPKKSSKELLGEEYQKFIKNTPKEKQKELEDFIALHDKRLLKVILETTTHLRTYRDMVCFIESFIFNNY